MFVRIFLAIVLICFIFSWNLIELQPLTSSPEDALEPEPETVVEQPNNAYRQAPKKLQKEDNKAKKEKDTPKNEKAENNKDNNKEKNNKEKKVEKVKKQVVEKFEKIVFLPQKQQILEDSLPVQQEITALTQLLAALPINFAPYQSISEDKFTKQHNTEFEKAWSSLKTQKLDKIATWKDTELKEINQQNNLTLFYPFSGPDILNAYTFFPNCDYYILFGLERIGELPKKDQLKGWAWATYLRDVRQALSEIFQRNYFITSKMGSMLNTTVKGVLPLISIFLARTDNEILSIQRIYLNKQGNPTYTPFNDYSKQGLAGLYIVFLNKNKNKAQRLYYFGTDLSDGAMANKKELTNFIKSFDNKITFVKSASYLLHGNQFSNIRNLILDETSTCFQDDTGIPYSYYLKNNWEVQLYGKYARPVRDFNYGYQLDLQKRFDTDKSVKPLDFTFGYHWWTDKSSILFCQKKK